MPSGTIRGLVSMQDSWQDVPLLLLVAESIQFEQLFIPEILKRPPKKIPVTWEGAHFWAGTQDVVRTSASFSMFARIRVSFSRLASSSTTIFWKASNLFSLVMESRNHFATLMCSHTRWTTTPSAPNLPLNRIKCPC